MKKLLLYVAMLFAMAQISEVNGQCTFGGLGVKINSTVPGTVPGTCTINFDLYFDVDHNPGSKYFWVHIWPTASYPAFNYGNPPTTSSVTGGNSALNNSLMTFGYFHQNALLNVMASYNPDPSVPNFQTNYTITEIAGTPDRYTAHGLTITLPQGCNIAQSLTADVWASQSADAQVVHCFSANQPFVINDPAIVNSLLFCQIPRRYKFDIATLSATNKTIDYKVVIDNGDGVYNAVSDNIQVNSGTVSINNTTPFQSGILDYAPYSSLKPYCDRALWIVVLKNGIDQPNDIYQRIDNTCIPLPVTLASFTASRRGDYVLLHWSTANELNNKGFGIQRKIGESDWQQVAFVQSIAPAGFSANTQFYDFSDFNNERGVTQYRLQQVDLDNQFTYSITLLVPGVAVSDKLVVFPNPTSDGYLTLLFKDGQKQAAIKLVGMDGKVVRQWDNFTGYRLELGNIPPGMYSLFVYLKETGERLTVKVIVNK